jgi:hypothetical protein
MWRMWTGKTNQCFCGYVAPNKPVNEYSKDEIDALIAHQDLHAKQQAEFMKNAGGKPK